MKYIGDKLDPKQFGGLKGNSISYCIIHPIHLLFNNQNYNLPISVLALAIDFSKAFNRQNQNILVTMLSDMGVLGWILFSLIQVSSPKPKLWTKQNTILTVDPPTTTT